MVNPMYPLILKEMGHILKVSKRELEGDIKEIAEYWETSLERTKINDRETAIFLLTTCSNCYLRGKNIRLDNYQRLESNHEVLVALVTLVTLYVWRQTSKYYPSIHEAIPVELGGTEIASQDIYILSEAEKILRERWED